VFYAQNARNIKLFANNKETTFVKSFIQLLKSKLIDRLRISFSVQSRTKPFFFLWIVMFLKVLQT